VESIVADEICQCWLETRQASVEAPEVLAMLISSERLGKRAPYLAGWDISAL
jgi:hypothetical protein